MIRHVALLLCPVLTIAVGGAVAQQPGTVVQLPTLSSFSARSTVTVPDRGRVYLGGVKRAAIGRNEFGVPLLPFRPFRNSAVGAERSASSMSVTATIHDFEAMDNWLLSRPTAFSSPLSPASRTMSGRFPQPFPQAAVAASDSVSPPRRAPVGKSWIATLPGTDGPATMSLAEARALRFRQQQVRSDEVTRLFDRGREAEAAGKPNVAKALYQIAARRADGAMRARIAQKLESLSLGQTASKVVQTAP